MEKNCMKYDKKSKKLLERHQFGMSMKKSDVLEEKTVQAPVAAVATFCRSGETFQCQ